MLRARRVRRRLRRQHQRRRVARHHPEGAAGPAEPHPSRRLRLRSAHRRRRRHAHPGARRVPAQGVRGDRHRAAAGRRVRRRPRLPAARRAASATSASASSSKIVREEGQRLLGWRTVPVDDGKCGAAGAHRTCPRSARSSSAAAARRADQAALERKLYVIRKRIERLVRESDLSDREYFYLPSLSSRTLVYKGLLLPEQIPAFYLDLVDPDMASALALVHQRFSTNTLPVLGPRPSVPLPRPQRRDQHAARQHQLDARAAEPCSPRRCSATTSRRSCRSSSRTARDSAMFDNALELLVHTGRSLPHAVMMMIPEAWQNHEIDERREEGVLRVSLLPDGAVGRPGVDRVHRRRGHRRGARPQRPAPVALRRDQGRLRRHGLRGRRARHRARERPAQGSPAAGPHVPGRHRRRAASSPTTRSRRGWRRASRIAPGSTRIWCGRRSCRRRRIVAAGGAQRRPADAPAALRLHARGSAHADGADGDQRPGGGRLDGHRHAAGGAVEQAAAAVQLLQAALRPGHQPADRPDPRGAGDVVGHHDRPGAEPVRRDTASTAISCGSRRRSSTNAELAQIKEIAPAASCARSTLPMRYHVLDGGEGSARGRSTSCAPRPSRAVADGATILVLSDRGLDEQHAPIPSLLATGAVHHHLIREGTRTRCGIVVESGEPREVHALRAAARLRRRRGQSLPRLRDAGRHDPERRAQGRRRPRRRSRTTSRRSTRACSRSMSKMGISTLQSYRGAQIFEAIGLNHELIDRYFTWTPSRIEGVGLDVIAAECAARHHHAYEVVAVAGRRSRRRRPVPVAAARRVPHVQPGDDRQAAARRAQGQLPDCSRSTRALVDDHSRDSLRTLRGLLQFKPGTADSDRGGRAGRARSSSGSRPAPCRSARSAARRTRTSPSP